MDDPIIPSPRKRKESNSSEYKHNKIKQARLMGRSYINHKGNEVPPKHPEFTCRCKKRCLDNFGEANCVDIFSKFYNIKNKDEQDLYIQGLVDVTEVQRRVPHQKNVEQPKQPNSFSYHVILGNERVQVCCNAFLSVLCITEKRLRRIRNLKIIGKTPEDKRGKGITHSISQNVHDLVSNHIRSFPLKQSHYSGKKIYYLDANLNIKAMWQLFCEKHPDVKVSNSFYWNHFKTNFNFRFGRPQVDTCCKCEELNLKIKSPHLNDVAKRAAQAELDVHKRMSNKFYKALKYEMSEDGSKEEHVLAIAFDYMKTISLPKIPVQQLYYMRQLSINVFSVNNIKEGKSHIYLYHEGQGRKGPNEVTTFLNDFLSSVPPKYTTLRLFCDNCSGQNKNQTLSRFCLYLTDSGRFHKVEQFFPIRGDSFLPCDRDFGIISRVLKTHDRLYHIHQLTELIISSSNSEKFTVKEISDATEFFDFKTWSTNHYKRSCISAETKGKNTPKERKVHFSISNLFHFVYEHDKKGYIKGFTNINGLVCHTFFMAKHTGAVPQVNNLAYPSGQVTLKKAKVEDIKKLSEYIPEEFNEFYTELYSWPTTPCEDLPDSDFEEETE